MRWLHATTATLKVATSQRAGAARLPRPSRSCRDRGSCRARGSCRDPAGVAGTRPELPGPRELPGPARVAGPAGPLRTGITTTTPTSRTPEVDPLKFGCSENHNSNGWDRAGVRVGVVVVVACGEDHSSAGGPVFRPEVVLSEPPGVRPARGSPVAHNDEGGAAPRPRPLANFTIY